MKLAGIVAEYNPFHNGHQFLIEKTREKGTTHIIAVMSGDFVQRGDSACLDKHTRARLACENGVDLVLELPIQYATASSERFAFGAISILSNSGVELLSFGSESGDVDLLKKAAAAVCSQEVMIQTKTFCEDGAVYPAAREKAVRCIFGNELADILKSPNDILGIEYIKAIDMLNSKIEPIAIKRIGAEHDATQSCENFASASFVRTNISDLESILKYIPKNTAFAIKAAHQNGTIGGGLNAIEKLVLYELRCMSADQLCDLPDCNSGLGNRLYAAASTATSLAQLFECAKTKRFTMSRVRRAVVHGLLNIREAHYFSPPYLRILAMGKNGSEVASAISIRTGFSAISSLSTLRDMGGKSMTTALLEANATDLFSMTQRESLIRGYDYIAKLFKIS